MKKLVTFGCLLIISSTTAVHGWGFFGHRTINYSAVFTCPKEIFPFYKKHIVTIQNQSVNPDKRRYIIEEEAPRHYLDADFYEKSTPLDTIPHNYDSAIARYGEAAVLSHGIVPWYVITMKHRLTWAFAHGEVDQIIRLSADIGHYIADLHVPLHSTHNYNGQLTDQHGIHGFWESRLPELFSKDYDFFVGEAKYIHNVSEEVWKHFEQSYGAKDSVLLIEKKLNQSIKQDKKYTYEQRGNQNIKTYSQYYSDLYHKKLDNMVERRMRESILMVGSMWFTCWVDAGQPDLKALMEPTISPSEEDSIDLNEPIKGRFEPH